VKILITGATGTVGGDVAKILAAQGEHVRVVARKPNPADFPAGVEVVSGDMTSAAEIDRALDGVQRAFLEHVALLSSFTVVVPLPSGDANFITARHRAGESALSAAGVPSTFLRGAGFDYNILMWLAGANGGTVRAPFADVALPKVDPYDIAASAAAVLSAKAPSPGAYTITGPQFITTREELRTVSSLLGRSLQLDDITFEEAKGLFPAGTPDFVRTSVLEALGQSAAVLHPTKDVEALTGRPARTFEQWATDHLPTIAGALHSAQKAS
jgi:uncharacterized protein YbjT (DUF2867 family)